MRLIESADFNAPMLGCSDSSFRRSVRSTERVHSRHEPGFPAPDSIKTVTHGATVCDVLAAFVEKVSGCDDPHTERDGASRSPVTMASAPESSDAAIMWSSFASRTARDIGSPVAQQAASPQSATDSSDGVGCPTKLFGEGDCEFLFDATGHDQLQTEASARSRANRGLPPEARAET